MAAGAARVDAVDRVNLGLVLLSCAIAHVFPVDLLVLVYAILGPAHYLTEISWLHDRNYFTRRRFDFLPLIAVTLIVYFIDDTGYDHIALVAGIAFAIAAVATERLWLRLLIVLAGTAAGVALLLEPVTAWAIILVPSMIHIVVFTAVFILLGALRNNSAYAYLTLAALVLCGATFFTDVIPSLAPSAYGLDNIMALQGMHRAFFGVLGFEYDDPLATKLFGFVAFALTYHYLNWFSKVSIIQWHRMPPRRLAAISLLYAGCVGLYFYDYALGFKIVLLISFGHVILEFPLNARSFAEVGSQIGRRLGGTRRAGGAA